MLVWNDLDIICAWRAGRSFAPGWLGEQRPMMRRPPDLRLQTADA
jgi:hypothetical protein